MRDAILIATAGAVAGFVLSVGIAVGGVAFVLRAARRDDGFSDVITDWHDEIDEGPLFIPCTVQEMAEAAAAVRGIES